MDNKNAKRATLEAAILAYGYQPTTEEMYDAEISSNDVAWLFQARGRMCNDGTKNH